MTREELFSINLRFYRRKKGLSQESLAERLGVSTRTIQFLESGTNLPSLSLAIKIAKVFEISLDELLGLNGFYDIGLKKKVSEMTEAEIKEAIDITKAIIELFRKL